MLENERKKSVENDILKIIIQVNVTEFSLKNEQRRMKLVMLDLVLKLF